MNYLENFMGYLQSEGKKEHTIKSYRSDLLQFTHWLQKTGAGQDLEPSALTQLNIAKYKIYMISDLKRQPSGINRALSAIGAFCEWAQNDGIITENPAIRIHQTKAMKKPPKVLSDVEIDRLRGIFHQSDNLRDIALFELMLGAGLKLNEVESLQLTDVEVNAIRGTVTVRQAGTIKLRQVPLNNETRQALVKYLEIRKEDDDALFLSQKGGGLTANAIWKIVKKYGDAAGFEELSPFTLRHTFGAMLVRKYNVDIGTVASLMGHENIQTTVNYCRTGSDDIMHVIENLPK
ncbi:MAG TPA: tyrosine-type recombinase/integrase [Bacillota bacterium]|nr:tyrosine-type recombinase/integrase [Bacillota bacterium]